MYKVFEHDVQYLHNATQDAYDVNRTYMGTYSMNSTTKNMFPSIFVVATQFLTLCVIGCPIAQCLNLENAAI